MQFLSVGSNSLPRTESSKKTTYEKLQDSSVLPSSQLLMISVLDLIVKNRVVYLNFKLEEQRSNRGKYERDLRTRQLVTITLPISR